MAQLFVADTEEGAKQFDDIEKYIDKEMEYDIDQMTEEIANKYIKTNLNH